jgi:hypothetical protein
MTQRHKHADVIIAWAEGAEVEYRNLPGATWVSVGTPGWYENYEYRVKPPTKKYRVGLFNNGNNGNYYTVVADTQEEAACYVDASGFVRWLTDWVEYEVL